MKTVKNFKDFILSEAFETKHAAVNTVKFTESSLKDSHVQNIIKQLAVHMSATKSGAKITPKMIEAMIIERQAELLSKYKSKYIHETSNKNIIESILFDMLEDSEFSSKTSPQFSLITFNNLISMIKSDHSEFFPLRSIFTNKAINPTIITVPNAQYPEYTKSITTAAATADGVFIFNKIFMQRLLDFGHMKLVKPKGNKYVSNGGSIPDEYAYIEFLIIHEFMHYTYADSKYREKYKEHNKIINYVGDFRTNYLLVKSGYEQLPIGLFSDHVNFDRQKSYKDMIDIVKKELTNDDEDTDHPEPGDGNGEPSDNDSKGEQGEGTSKSGPSDGEISDSDIKDMDDMHKQLEKEFGKDRSEEAKTPEEARERLSNDAKELPSSKANVNTKLEVVTKVSWQSLLTKLIHRTSASLWDETRLKPSSRTASAVVNSIQTGSSVLPSIEVKEDDKKHKLVFVLDSSGSMDSVISKVYSQVHSVVSGKGKLDDQFYIVKFSGSHLVYACSISKKSFSEVSLDEIYNDKATVLGSSNSNIKDVFSKTISGGTNFSSSLSDAIIKSTNNKNAVIIVSDEDILSGSNLDNFKHVLAKANKGSIGVIMANENCFKSYFSIFKNTYSAFATFVK